MKKVVLIFSVLAVAVISTACINNLAVQDLNNRAKGYMAQGDYIQAIERLKSSIDLEPSIYETHYNLAVAYTQNEEYEKAISEYDTALKLKPNSSEVYYSLATAQYNLALDLKQGKLAVNEAGELNPPPAKEEADDEPYKMDEASLEKFNELYENVLKNYKKYLRLNPKAEEREEIEMIMEKVSKALYGEE